MRYSALEEWAHDFNWKKLFLNERIYLMREHNWAFAAWEIERIQGKLQANSVLVHVDSHLDDVPDGLFVKGVLDILTSEEALRIAEAHDYSTEIMPDKQKMDKANFIWPAFVRGTIGPMFFICDDAQKELFLGDFRKYVQQEKNDLEERFDLHHGVCEKILELLSDKDHILHRTQTIDEFIQKHERLLREYIKSGNTTILDLDLDFFNDSDNYIPKIKDESEIRRILRYLKGLHKWDVITVAMSPFYCGGNEQCEYLLHLFLDEFRLDLEGAKDWT